MSERSIYACPECGTDNRVEKVSIVYQRGIESGSYAGPSVGGAAGMTSDRKGLGGIGAGYSRLEGTSQTAQSQLLSPPSKPERKGYSGCCSLFGFVVFPALGFLGLVPLLFFNSNVVRQLGFRSGPSFLFRLPFLIWVGAAVLGTVLVFYLRGRHNDRQSKLQSQKIPVWNDMMEEWNQLYYCNLHGLVFLPNSDLVFPPEMMIPMLVSSVIEKRGDLDPVLLKEWK